MQLLENLGKEILLQVQNPASETALVLKWQANDDDFDLAFRLHAFQLSEEKANALVTHLKAIFPEIIAFEFAEGYLNLKFSDQTWHRLTESWCQDSPVFLDAAGLRQAFDPNLDPNHKVLRSKDIHFLAHARAIAEIPGWQIAADDSIPIEKEALLVLKEILRLGSGKSVSLDERTRKSKSLALSMRRLWQSPVLIPSDPQGSCFRQKILHLGLVAATALLGESIQTAPVE